MSVFGLTAPTAEWMQGSAQWIQVALGAALLLLGRRLFWLFVAAVGFFIGLWLAETYITAGTELVGWAVGLLVGTLSALAAVFLQRFAVAVGGALVAGYSTFWYLSLSLESLESWHWLLIVGAAVLGLLVARFVFDFGLIFLSAIAGATIVLEALPAAASTSRWLFLLLVVVGASVQASTLPDRKRRKD